MNVSIFGATGATGKLLTERCLSAGYTVRILARDPRSFSLAGYVEAITGDARDLTAVRQTIRGSDLVLSALGAKSWKREDLLETAVPLIITAMQEQKVRRIIVVGSAGAVSTSLDKQPAYRRWIAENILYKTALKWPVTSQRAQYKALSASNLDWTMVMPPMLRDSAPRRSYRIDGEALPRNGVGISRAELADFMMLQVNGAEWVRRGVYISW
ncbi:NAD(P)H-binding protein [Granulicella sp. dw_53]|uniref:NAD(P)-dependent oxidoreductase n=1 Tax=Granulicella sp. dw_53 TaxID=2719792 RepID=UPI001BD40483|nr:NAD(P)H-binding protein [Granulicella sp. dw_53]